MKVTRDKKELIVRVPLFARRYNPYLEQAGKNPDTGQMENIVGLIYKDEIGFAYLIDRDYKGKCDDCSSIFLHYDGDEKDFKKLCAELKISWWCI